MCVWGVQLTGIGFIDVFAVIAVVVGGLAAAAKASRVLEQFGDTLDDLRGDLRGEPDRPGVPGRPGVMTRLAKIEAELQPNHGSSLRDAVNRIEVAVQQISERFDRHIHEHHGVK